MDPPEEVKQTKDTVYDEDGNSQGTLDSIYTLLFTPQLATMNRFDPVLKSRKTPKSHTEKRYCCLLKPTTCKKKF